MLDDLVETQVPHVAELAIALRHRADAVAYFQTAVGLGRPAGNETLDLGVAVFRPEHRADPDEGKPHVNAEVLQVGFAQIFGVRVVSLRKRIEKQLYLFFLVLFVDVAGETIVAARDELRARLDRVFAQVFLEQLARNASAPDLISFRLILRPGRFLSAQLNGPVLLEIDRLLDQGFDLRHPGVDPLGIEIINLVGRFQVPQQDIVVQRRRILGGERIDIVLGEKEMAEIEQLEIGAKEFLGNLVVQRLVGVVALFQEPSHGNRHLLGVGFGLGLGRHRHHREGEQDGGEREGAE